MDGCYQLHQEPNTEEAHFPCLGASTCDERLWPGSCCCTPPCQHQPRRKPPSPPELSAASAYSWTCLAVFRFISQSFCRSAAIGPSSKVCMDTLFLPLLGATAPAATSEEELACTGAFVAFAFSCNCWRPQSRWFDARHVGCSRLGQ